MFQQNEVRKIKPGQEAEIALKMIPGRIIKCKVDSIVGHRAGTDCRLAARALPRASRPSLQNIWPCDSSWTTKDKAVFLASGAHGAGAVYTDHLTFLHLLRKVMLRVSTKLDWLILKLH